MKPFWKNEKGAMLIWISILTTVLMIMSGTLYEIFFQESRLVNINGARNKAFYLAEAGVDKKLTELRVNNLNPTSSTLGGGSYSATYCTSTSNPSCSSNRIVSVGTTDGISKTLTVVVKKLLPKGVRGAISANGDVALNGSIIVDGRNYNENGTAIVDSGTYGISSGGTVNQGGSSKIGGNGIAPAKPANPVTIEENATDNIFTTPEEVLGLDPGSLDQYKTSTPPSSSFNGIVYLTTDWTSNVNFGDASHPSTGILIVHNSSGNALLKNLHGTFKGIIIADDLVHINGDAELIGGVVLQKSSGNTVGNGSAWVKYSTEAMSKYGSLNYSIVSWEDNQNYPSYTYS